MQEPPDLAGTAVLITGAACGLGRAMAAGLAEAGASVIGMDLPAAIAEMGTPDNVIPFSGDVTNAAACGRAVALAVRELGGLHMLVNNAGIGMHVINERFLSQPTPFWEVSPAQWRTGMEVNATGPFLMARAAVPALLASGWGRIVNVTTTYVTMLRPGFSPYGPSKAAAEAATAIWAKDLAGTGVTVNALLPGGGADTQMISDDLAFPDRSRLVQPGQMVPPLLWLASRASDGVSGRRFAAKDWDGSQPPESTLRTASAPVAWSDEGTIAL